MTDEFTDEQIIKIHSMIDEQFDRTQREIRKLKTKITKLNRKITQLS